MHLMENPEYLALPGASDSPKQEPEQESGQT